MRPVNRSELFSVSTFAFAAMLIVFSAVLIGGCGGGDSPSVSTAALVNPQSQRALRLASPLADAGNTVRPLGSSYPGDMDGDGLPSVGDAIKILRFVVGLDMPDSTESWLADVNSSGDPDVSDAIKVLRAVVGLEQWPLPWPPGTGPPPPPF